MQNVTRVAKPDVGQPRVSGVYEKLPRISEEDGRLSIHVDPDFHAIAETAPAGN
ncbi:hypothetical protein HP499_23270 [Paenarthrobacter sp. CM16]|jgi:hypothetical protein|uniref:hypothetical protein n=1 Tax=Paenarthrobacter sp. CM16 TaxID=2738447 RepID=UPI0015534250|nr:hypothetical protein [Paenarthrobacter sp. CM16]NQD90707.1 hypothetical protein [Paenarthrobacter sp. CM16]